MNVLRALPNRETNELKQIMRSIIETNGNKIKIKFLVRDYKQMIGSDLPFEKFGYESVLDLIKDMDDTFGVEAQDKHKHQNDYCVYCLPEDKTRHIVEFVQNQKHSEERDKEVLNPSVNIFNSKTKAFNQRSKVIKPFKLNVNIDSEENGPQIVPQNNYRKNDFNRNRNLKSSKRAVCPLPDSRVISTEVKIDIIKLMNRFPSINLLNFSVIYHTINGKPFDFKRLGFSSLDQFLKQIPDLVRLETTSDGIRVFKVFNETNELVSTQTTVGLCNGTKPNGLQNGYKSVQIRQSQMNSKEEKLNEILKILRSKPEGIPIHQLVNEYYKTYRKPFITSVWGYGSAIEMFAIMRDTFCLKRPEDGSENTEDWLLFESTPQLRSQMNAFNSTPKKKKFEQKLKDNVNKVMQKINKTPQQKELFVNEFNDAYDLCFNQTIDPKVYGFKDIKQFLVSLSKECDFEVKERVKDRPFLVYKKNYF